MLTPAQLKKLLKSVVLKVFWVSLAVFIFILCIFPFPHAALKNIKYSQTIYDSEGNLLRTFLNQDDHWLLACNLAAINPWLIKASIAVEDNRFYQHYGIDLPAIIRALKLNLANKRIISGASTISMQVVGLLEQRNRTYFNKLIEAIHAVILEIFYSKQQILEFYLQLAPYGGNLLGAKAASLRFFNKLPENLTLAESALLAGLPQAPSNLRPDRYPNKAKIRRNQVLKSMLKNNYITKQQYDSAIAEEVLAKFYPFPFQAPHFCQFVHQRHIKQANIKTSLDLHMQQFATAVIRETVAALQQHGINNGALVIIENKTGKIRTMVGSSDFFATIDAGQINGVLCKRCPGSTLTPFTYALGFAAGIYTPNSILNDMPVEYSGYMPINYDHTYHGKVSVRDALALSLNVPAVEVLNKVGYKKLYHFMQQIGFSTLSKNPAQYGLALTLGAAEVNLLELTNAYATIARLGLHKPFNYLEADDAKEQPLKQELAKKVAYLINDILADNTKFENIKFYRKQNSPKIACKTGTSYGHRDAWTIAFNPDYTIGVWLGNFSAKPAKALVGTEVAAPIALKVFDWLYLKKPAPWYKVPENIASR